MSCATGHARPPPAGRAKGHGGGRGGHDAGRKQRRTDPGRPPFERRPHRETAPTAPAQPPNCSPSSRPAVQPSGGCKAPDKLADDPDFRRRFRREIAAAQRVRGADTAELIDAADAHRAYERAKAARRRAAEQRA
ncbi:hypothetical protein MUU72_10280 [Streptomyces sp. RS10V-4]|uniref:hypothetical protein n=1 Tax=Streptomyces rhizoryzae TaxID=2932493 RepID=UPI0020044E59|nr:hypothetical protein [Streptomyces rhizoryzae]MCK7623475.1 hypothetical protein [Streptomyces rhizoryzae]